VSGIRGMPARFASGRRGRSIRVVRVVGRLVPAAVGETNTGVRRETSPFECSGDSRRGPAGRSFWSGRPGRSMRPGRRGAVLGVVLAGVSLSAVPASPQPTGVGAAARPPNVVLFVADDQGWGDLGVSGNANVRTPHIDRLAARGASFERFFVSPVCSPTRAELLTGRYHPRSGVYGTSAGGERMDLDETTLADAFRRAGYATGTFGKWHNGTQPPYHPLARGFDEFYGFTSGHWGHYFSPPLDHDGRRVRGDGYVADDFTDKAVAFIERHRDAPFLVLLAFNTPHSPMQVPDRWWARFAAHPVAQRHREPEREDVAHTRAALAMVENLDWNVGRVVARLEALGLTGDTILVYLSDNGPNGWRWNGGMKGRKGSTDEGGVRSPLFVQWVGRIAAGTAVEPVAAAIDLLPTLTDLAGVSLASAPALDGISLRPLLEPDGPGPDWPARYLVQHWRGRTSVRGQRFRLDADGRLFDLVADPGQAADVANRHPGVAAAMVEARDAWVRDVLAELPDVDRRPFPVGHPAFRETVLPARDGVAHGGVERSNRFPNDSFFTSWTGVDDAITWNVEVVEAGRYEILLHYACREEDVGSRVEVRLGSSVLTARIADAHDPPLEGMEADRTPRIESYVKDFRPLSLGVLDLDAGPGTLSLRALEIPGREVADVRALVVRRVGS